MLQGLSNAPQQECPAATDAVCMLLDDIPLLDMCCSTMHHFPAPSIPYLLSDTHKCDLLAHEQKQAPAYTESSAPHSHQRTTSPRTSFLAMVAPASASLPTCRA
eukprot:1138656-Pelagomonas_calceolata.AAC.8